MVEATNNSTTGDIQEEISQIRTELGLVIKNVSGGAEKVNAVNYFDKPPLPLDEYYYKKRHICSLWADGGFFDQMPKFPFKIIGAKDKEIKVWTIVITTERVNMSKMRTKIATTISTWITMVIGMNGVVHLLR